MSDTGDEHRDTRAYQVKTREICKRHNIPFYFVARGLGYHTGHWRKKGGLVAQYRATNTIGMRTMRSCTDNLKLVPIYKFLDRWIGEQYGFPSGEKRAIKAYERVYGKIDVIIGFARGEERRVLKAAASEVDQQADQQIALDLPGLKPKKKPRGIPVWFKTCIRRVFPLVDLGMDRQDCQRFIESCGRPVPPPSNCRRCHHKTDDEILLMSFDDSAGLAEWIELEENKKGAWAERCAAAGRKNDGVYGDRDLRSIVHDTREKYAHLSDEELVIELRVKRQSRGHCVTTGW